ncbi:MAG: penicillin acylase family protein [Dehalococcoidia bacterium]|jgi:penicillin amidase|nr:penicillin acylase family protein [Dehalococcoidia bacterium]MDP7261717.1 penicillin acylase family protein [Dehalococcoidia bacterium]
MTKQISESDLQNALPDVESDQKLAGIVNGATIHRDQWGIPHITADNETDLFFAQGFATAQDRLFQMDYDRLRCLGRSAEHLGERGATQDRLMRRRSLKIVSKRDLEVCSPEAKAMITAYTAGVNAFIESAAPLPVEYQLTDTKPEKWEDWHCILVYKVRNTAEGSFQAKLWLAKLSAEIGPERTAAISPGSQPGALMTVPPGAEYSGPVLNAIEELTNVVNVTESLRETDGGSNGWAISGDRTESGLPLVAGDSHRGLEVPNVYYQVHLQGPGFQTLGHSIPGVPMAMHFAHNDYVGWGMTHGGADTQDLFVEQLRRAESKVEYLFKGEWLEAVRSVEKIKVRDGESKEVEIVETHHGPIISGSVDSGWGVAISDPGSRGGTKWVDAAYGAMKSQSADELETAFDTWTDRVNNYPYADIHGNFGYLFKGRVPSRSGVNGWGPVPGWTGEYEWNGFIPKADLPRSKNPDCGWIVTCNQRVVGEDYEYYLTHLYGTDYRARRIRDRIDDLSDRKATIADMSSIHADTVSIPAQALCNAILALTGLAGVYASSAGLLARWDHDMKEDSAAAAVYAASSRELNKQLAMAGYGSLANGVTGKQGDSGAEDQLRRQLKPDFIRRLGDGSLPDAPYGFETGDLVENAFKAGIDYLVGRFGDKPGKWRWGDLHKTGHIHPLTGAFPGSTEQLNPPKVETSGDSDVPFASGSPTPAEFAIKTGPINRYIHDPSNWSNGRWIVPLGSSGHPGSPHFADQQEMWAKIETIPQLWDWAEIASTAETTQRLLPV